MIERIDARGLRCPWPAIRLAKAMRQSDAPVFEIEADDPAAPGELRRVAEAAGRRFEVMGGTLFRIARG